MNKLFIITCFLTIIVCISSFSQDLRPSAVQDTVQQGTRGNGGDDGELVLDAIEIKGRVEKPSVIIMPKRIEPEVGEVELERDFEQELKEGIGEIPKPEDDMNKVERVQSIKKTVERDRE